MMVGSADVMYNPLLPTTADDDQEYRSYRSRWLVLILFCFLNMSNAVVWITFAPIQDIASEYYSQSSTLINMCSVVYMIFYLPSTILASWIFEKYGLRVGLLLGAVIQALAAWMRMLSTFHTSAGGAFAFVIIGQCMGASVQPFFTNTAAKLSGEWFSVEQRNMATTIGAMSNPLGIAVGQVLPSLIVKQPEDMPTLLLIEAIVPTVIGLIAIFALPSRPLTPPSRSAASRVLHKSDAGVSSLHQLYSEVIILLKDKNFIVLMIAFGIGLGCFNALTTLIEQIIKPAGYTSDNSGNFGGLLIFCGLLGAGVVGGIMDYTHRYNLILKIGIIGALGGITFMLVSLRPDQPYLVGASFGVMGACVLPLLPVALETAVECTYPVSEDASSGLLMTMGNLLGMGLIFLVGWELDQRPTYDGVFTPASYTLFFSSLVAALLLLLFYHGPTKRTDQDMHKPQDSYAPISN